MEKIKDQIPLVSIVMPAYNGEKYIGAAIEHILNQTYSNIELIIVEDCSTDNTLKIIEQIEDERLVLIKNNTNRGISYSTNLAIEKSHGKYIALHDDDDISALDRIEVSVDYMENHEEIDIVGGGSLIIDENDSIVKNNITPRSNPKVIKAMLLFKNLDFCNSTAMIRKKFLSDNNLKYRNDFLGMQDYQFYVEASKKGSISSVSNILLYYRQHSQNETTRQKRVNSNMRSELFADIQRNSIRASGFKLNETELQIINDMVSEQMKTNYTVEEIGKLKEVFKQMIIQAEMMNIDWLDELRWQCRKILSERLVRSDFL